MNKRIFLLAGLIALSICQESIEINKSKHLAKELLCQENRLCKLENCDQVKKNVTERVLGKGTRFAPPQEEGEWQCLQERQFVIKIYCAYGVWYKNVTKEETHFKNPEVCEGSYDDKLTFESIDKIQIDIDSLKSKCKVGDSGEEGIKNVGCLDVTFYANAKINQECGNKVNNVVRTKYSLDFDFDIQPTKDQGTMPEIDIDYIGNQLRLVENKVIESDFNDFQIELDNEVFRELQSSSQARMMRQVMTKIANEIGSHPPFSSEPVDE